MLTKLLNLQFAAGSNEKYDLAVDIDPGSGWG